MRKVPVMVFISIMIISVFAMTSCSKPIFNLTDNTEKAMTIEAKNAAVDDFFMVGSLTVSEGEEISVTSDLEKGSVKLEFIAEQEEQSIDELPNLDGEPAFTAPVSGDDKVSCAVGKGDYMLRATVTEKATGTIQIDVIPVE